MKNFITSNFLVIGIVGIVLFVGLKKLMSMFGFGVSETEKDIQKATQEYEKQVESVEYITDNVGREDIYFDSLANDIHKAVNESGAMGSYMLYIDRLKDLNSDELTKLFKVYGIRSYKAYSFYGDTVYYDLVKTLKTENDGILSWYRLSTLSDLFKNTGLW